MNILITSAGRRVSLLRAFEKELCEIYPQGKIFASDQYPELSSACQIANKCFRVSRVTSPNYIEEIITICRENSIRLIIPTIDDELKVFAKNRGVFKKNGIECVVSDFNIVCECRDKRKIKKFFERYNFGCIKEYGKESLGFPFFVKPFNGSGSKGTFVVENSDMLSNSLMLSEDLMFMEYLDPLDHIEYTVDLYYDIGSTLKCIIPRERIEVRAGEVSKGMTKKNFLLSYLKDRISIIDGFHGCITLQVFVRKRDKMVFGIEVNPRFGGGYPLSYAAGANFPKWIIREYLLKEPVEYDDKWDENLLMLRYDDEILIHDFKN